MKSIHYLLAIAVASVVTACSSAPTWSVKGSIDGSEGKLVTLERSYNGYWNVLDSVRPGADGSFSFKTEPAGYADIYRVRVNDWTAYFPIDSIENITLNADLATKTYTLAGSDDAVMFNEINKLIDSTIAAKGNAAANDSILKRQLSGVILGDMNSIVSYYIINKKIDGQPIFNPADKGDLRVIGAVVNSFSALRPNDPRTRIMEQQYIANRRALNTQATTIEAVEIGYPDITLKDVAGQERSISDIVGHGRPVIVNFTAYAADYSPAINVILNNIYETGQADIYQISVDADEYVWQDAARNLPWVTVYNSPRDGDRALRVYNVIGVPVSYIIDGSGRLQERVDDVAKLPEVLKKYK
ncbi:MAG: hypothetical protein K2N28_10295 [Muribaculaceae bacterium]|nr:hypothetical protein [Muribaculaceae bacterium]